MTAIARRLLVLGAKPDPILPPPGSFDAVACANASGRSAADLGLPTPVFTVLTALLTDGSEAGRMRLASLAGLATGTVHFYPQRLKGRTALERALVPPADVADHAVHAAPGAEQGGLPLRALHRAQHGGVPRADPGPVPGRPRASRPS